MSLSRRRCILAFSAGMPILDSRLKSVDLPTLGMPTIPIFRLDLRAAMKGSPQRVDEHGREHTGGVG